jgi:transcription elongation factor GreA
MAEEIYLTEEGAKRLRAELAELTGPRREELAGRLRTAIQQGDLSENADYITAKEEQGFLEGRIQEIEAVLRQAVIVDPRLRQSDVVEIGSNVTIQEDDYPAETYTLVGVNEADARQGRISHVSPIGRALLGHKAGDSVSVETPAGSTRFKILKIE